MLIKARELLQRELQCYDVCIVGAGPAGLSLAKSLSGTGIRTCVVESGDQTPEPFADSLRDLESTGIQIRHDSRERVLGGTSTTWTGLSSPLDDIDFSRRAWVPHSGWPIGKEELVPYYRAASQLFRFPMFSLFSDASWLPDAGGRVPVWEELKEKPFLASDPPQNFGLEFASVCKDTGVDLILGATVTNLVGDASSGEVRGVRLALNGEATFTLLAHVVVLACGGIENARVLLNSTFSCAQGLGNERDQVGRYFMNHPKGNVGIIELQRPAGPLPGYFGFLASGSGYMGYVGLQLSETTQEREAVLNSYVRFEPVFDWSDNPGVEIAVDYIKRTSALMRVFRRVNKDKMLELRSYAETGDVSKTTRRQEGFAQHLRALRELIRHSGSVGRYASSRLSRRLSQPKVTSIRLRNFLEMAPGTSNRVTLDDRVDAFGVRLSKVTHQCCELDKRSIVTLHGVLAREVDRAGWGCLHSDLEAATEPWPINNDASHHMGATRMGTNPATSVVNPDCRVHSTRNVYVAGSSVFPTSGCANPTYTIVALAIRLGEHLQKKMCPGRVDAGALRSRVE
jgi:choline dehydrogenase-like flavoprotein